ncbi:ubiB [Symbiodinium pilosum]|uniref:UbiB protein n=1 Tax=Symbiodinium pilosum TaxID=2952 RepID=A0A812YEU1_SYMPI|nr:ubiB [Symbiodinium pilosum]
MGTACTFSAVSSEDELDVESDQDPWAASELSNSLPVVQYPQSASPSIKPRPKQKVARPEASFLPLQQLEDQSPWASKKTAFCSLRKAAPRRANFNGLWFCFETHGDMDALLVSLEVSWAKRCAASAISYGAGYVSRKITQGGDEMEMEVVGTPSDFTQRFRVGAGWQRASGPDGDCWVHPFWEDGVLWVEQMDEEGTKVLISHQLMPWGLVITMFANGVSAGWKFRKQ